MTEQHVPVERLAAYAAGDLDASAAVEVEAHVVLCAGCRADVEAVRRATGALAELGPVTMPADVAARVDAAVARADRPTGPVGDVLPMASAKKRRPSFAGLAAVAAGVALIAGVGVPLVTGGGGGERGANTTAAESAQDTGAGAGTRRLDSGLNYRPNALDTTLVRALRGASAVPNADAFGGAGTAPPEAEVSGPSAPAAPDAVRSSGRDLTQYATSLTALESDAGRLAACVTALAASQPRGLGTTPLVVDFARFNDRPALVVVFPTVSRGKVADDRVDVWVVGARCGVTAGDDDVLLFERLDRPAGL